MSIHRLRGLVSVAALIAIAQCTEVRPDETSLRDSFADRIAETAGVTAFTHTGDELRFTGPGDDGTTADWRVIIERAQVDPNDLDAARPYLGHITSAWYADGELVEYLGTMTALPAAYLDRGVGQECWAYWIAAERRWDW